MADDNAAQANITAFWSAVAADYEAHEGNVPAKGSAENDAWIVAISRLLPPAPADVLDVACGTGFVTLIAASLGHRVTGIDLSEPMLDEARAAAQRLALDVRFKQGDAVLPGFVAESFDTLISRHFLWTLRAPLVAFRNWRALLRPGGRVVAIDGFWFDESPAVDAPLADDDVFGRHYSRATRDALPVMSMATPAPLADLFRAAGFSGIEVSDLADVHAVAANPPSVKPWYVIVATRE